MTPTTKRAALAAAGLAGRIAAVLPAGLRRKLVFALLVLESRTGAPDAALRRLFAIADDLDLIIDERATALGGGAHPKHRLTRYHEYFIGHIGDGDRVLDIGCGLGFVARAIARARPQAKLLGVDIDAANIAGAQRGDNPPNLEFRHADATERLPEGAFDVVVLSNVLEHLDERPAFIRRVVAATQAHVVLIRVPLFERDWRLPMRKELGITYFSDPTHRIEHTLQEFAQEIAEGGLTLVEQRLIWGEIWALCRPQAPAVD
jgi:SAM-dependent methyltransferase